MKARWVFSDWGEVQVGRDLCKNFTSLKIVQSCCFGECYNSTKKMQGEEEEEEL
jgi:hypothetical protein